MDAKEKAYLLARQAAEIDFSMALQGILAGNQKALSNLQELLVKKDAALLASLALSQKGARMGAGKGLAKTVCDGIDARGGLRRIEQEFLDENKENTP